MQLTILKYKLYWWEQNGSGPSWTWSWDTHQCVSLPLTFIPSSWEIFWLEIFWVRVSPKDSFNVFENFLLHPQDILSHINCVKKDVHLTYNQEELGLDDNTPVVRPCKFVLVICFFLFFWATVLVICIVLFSQFCY